MKILLSVIMVVLLITTVSAFSINYSPSVIVKTLNVNKPYCSDIYVGGDWKTATLSTNLKNIKVTGKAYPNQWSKICITPTKKGKYDGYLYITTNVDGNSRFKAGIRLILKVI